ncbi:DNA mismatch repair protein [Phlyctema vagabunda]|uniref:DNA mismatch repair protein n=1 Tax=Phlyctema vagabunda TaxID=108571 RepID=A0ABR4P6N3_9HELO
MLRQLWHARATTSRQSLSRWNRHSYHYDYCHNHNRHFPQVAWRVPCRGKKTRASASLPDLPQGVIPLDPLPLEKEEEEEDSPYSTVITQVRSNMRRFENCVVLTRVGGFYELYFEHAEQFGPLLNLKVGHRRTRKNTNAPPVPMAGFPWFQLDRYLKVLVQDLNRYVAIADEFPNDPSGRVKAGGLLHDRRVSRIITPGTLIDENFMDPLTNNYVLAIHADHGTQQNTHGEKSEPSPTSQFTPPLVGLAWLDLSTGHFFTQSTTLLTVASSVARICPRELVLDSHLRDLKDHEIFATLVEDHHLITYADASLTSSVAEWEPMLETPVLLSKSSEFTAEEVAAGSLLLHYVETRLRGLNLKLQPPLRQLDVMGIDKNTMKALEIKKTMKDGLTTGSLLHTVRRTVTKGGARLLDAWLSSPSTSLAIINSRLDLVTYMLEAESLREQVIILLRRSHDSHRLLQRFAFGRGDPDDLIALASTIHATQELLAVLMLNPTQENCIRDCVARIHIQGPKALADRIRDAIDEEGVVQQHRIEESQAGEIQTLAQDIIQLEGSSDDLSMLARSSTKKRPSSIREHHTDNGEAWIMKPAASSTLKQLHQELDRLITKKHELGQDLCGRLGATSLTLRFTPGLGHICHIKGKDIKMELIEGRNVSSSRSTRSFHHPEWTALGQGLDHCKATIRAEEQRVFSSLREEVIHNVVKLRRNAAVLDELDIACSFATLASEKSWVRPILNMSSAHKIVGGRHPTVESGLQSGGRTFTTNDCFVGDTQPLWLLTGPNMAGKSTFLRQNALITILAQVGSYVPAEYAELGIVDHVFSRVGSADNLYLDQSTFMVEMLETAAILGQATPRSFVIMDEIGRGTTPEDGTAIAFACLHHLYHVNKCRSLFATHFHTLADLAEQMKMHGVGLYCTDVEEDEMGSGFRYLHKLRVGVNKKSHALKVARLAGLPETAIGMARKIMDGGLGLKDSQ